MSNRHLAVWHRILASLTLIALLAFGSTGRASAGSILRVKYNATGAGTGATWADAYTSLQSALGAAANGDQIWVAKGTYKPNANRISNFAVPAGVAVYGGFAGGETRLGQRNWKTNVTILSGDIGNPGDFSDNTYHVVFGTNWNSFNVLDGFTILGGNANGAGLDEGTGGGLIATAAGSPVLQNLIISGNHGSGCAAVQVENGTPVFSKVVIQGNVASGPGGMCLWSSAAMLTNVAFTGNQGSAGGALAVGNAAPSLTDVSFTNNSSANEGGALALSTASAHLNRVTFSGNSATEKGGAILSSTSSPVLTDVTFNGNYVQGNTSPAGGAVYNSGGSPQYNNVTFTGNYVDGSDPHPRGGAVFNDGGFPTFHNVTLNGNTAKGAGGIGGAMYNLGSSPYLYNVTFNGNLAAGGAGAMHSVSNSNANVFNSILWNNGTEVARDGTGVVNILDSLVTGSCPSDANCTGALVTSDPLLGPLQNNGGFTQTLALGGLSPAIDAADDGNCEAADQRAVVRPMAAHCDMGAYEVRAMKFLSVGRRDGQLLESGRNTNLGGSVNIKNPIMLLGDSAKNRRYRGVLSFSTGPLPGNVKVVRANLQFLQQNSSGNPFLAQGSLVADIAKPYFGSDISLVTSDWQAKPSAGSVANFGNTLLTNGSWYSASLSGPGLARVNKNGTTQFKLRFSLKSYNGIGETIGIASGNDPIAANRPMLIVYYNP